MAVGFSNTNKPINPRGQDASSLAYNRAKLYSGKALDFDGVNDIITGQMSSPVISGAHSFFAYVYADSDYGSGYNYIFSSGNAQSGQQISLGLHGTSGGNVLFSSGYSSPIIESTFAIESQKYVSVGYSYDGTDLTFYFNGQALDTQTIALAPVSGNYRFGQNMGAGTYFNGKISNAKIFSTALTASQVADLYNNPEKVVPTGVDNTALKLWLPMMEGTGTTAYDGSGNGNHGTISGATYVNGIGAPVAQSAVIDWNKGSNFFSDSSWLIASATTLGTISSSSQSAPNGVDTASVYNEGTGTTFNRGYKASNTGMAVGEITASTFVKKKDVDYINVALGTEGGTYKFYALVDLVNGTIVATDGSPTATSIQSVGNGWYYVSVQATHSSLSPGLVYVYGQDPTNTTNVDINYTGTSKETYIWGINIQEGAINNVHLPTIGTLQSSEVLLPQGLTTGRDITGVNLFENVRKQGALNLDGNSWAEVHDNASLDFGKGSFTLEVWSKAKYISSGSIYNVLLTLGDNVSGGSTSSIYIDSSLNYTFRYDSTLIVAGGSSEGDWSHVVGVYDGTNINIYLNGSFVVQAAASATSKTNDLVKVIGRDSSGNSRAYKDQIAQPRIYNRALTAEEVLRNYNSGKNTYK